MDQAETPKRYATKKQVQARYGGVSHMFIKRLLARDPRFPRPFHFPNSSVDFFDLGALEQYEKECVANPPLRGAPPARTSEPKQRRGA
jgi:hypothetical protein